MFHAGDCRLLSDQIFNNLELSEFDKVDDMQMYYNKHHINDVLHNTLISVSPCEYVDVLTARMSHPLELSKGIKKIALN